MSEVRGVPRHEGWLTVVGCARLGVVTRGRIRRLRSCHVGTRQEAPLRPGRERTVKIVLGVLVIVWLLIGALAALQRGYFSDDRDVSCKTGGDTVLTIFAGPLNYVGVNPRGWLG